MANKTLFKQKKSVKLFEKGHHMQGQGNVEHHLLTSE